jgi:hypothetical protein
MSHLLMEDRPLVVLPRLAKAIGLNEAIVLQQIYFRIGADYAVVQDGKRWWRAPMDRLEREFIFWSVATIERVIKSLKDLGLIESKRSRDGNLYTVDFTRIPQIEGLEPSIWPVQTPQVEGSPSIEEGKQEEQEELFAAGPTAESPEDQLVSDVWTHYFALFGEKLRVKDVTPARRRMILKAFKAVGEDKTILLNAITGLKSYRDSHPDGSQDVALSVIFETGPHSGRNLTDQVEWWSTQAPGGAAGEVSVQIPHHLKHQASQHQIAVAKLMNRQPPVPESVERDGEAGRKWLRETLNIEARRREDGTIQWVNII